MHAIRAARAAGWFVILNPAPAHAIVSELLPLIDLIAPNKTEAAALAGSSDPSDAAQRLLTQGARAVVVTLGGEGALYCSSDGAWRCPAVAVQPVDTTAAGDAYIGALAAALAEERSILESLGFAAAAAGLAVTRLGAQPSLPMRQEVDEFIARYGALRAVAV
jgi:ribokinase